MDDSCWTRRLINHAACCMPYMVYRSALGAKKAFKLSSCKGVSSSRGDPPDLEWASCMPIPLHASELCVRRRLHDIHADRVVYNIRHSSAAVGMCQA